jgi:hypothetical protein
MYNSEQDLVNSFKSLSKKFLSDVFNTKTTRTFLIQEFDSLNGVADLVLGTYLPHTVTKTARSPIDINWVTPLASLNIGDAISADEFMAAYTVTKNTASKILRDYAKGGFLQQIDNKEYKVIKSYAPILDNVISIEAKLKNWQRALNQAYRYKRFSNFTFVLLEEKHSSPAIKNLDLFEKMGVGLITMQGMKYNMHSTPARKEVNNSPYFHRVNEVAYTTVSNLASFS